jgi:hypothetical protein
VGAGGRSGLLWAVASDGRARAASERSSANENGPRYVDKTRHETREGDGERLAESWHRSSCTSLQGAVRAR